MNRPIFRFHAVLLLVSMLFPTAPAWAQHFVGITQFEVSCASGLHLKQATGVPGGGVHTYAFGGTCTLLLGTTDGPQNYAQPPLVASAHWDEATHTFTESLHLLASATYTNLWTGQPDVHTGTSPEIATFKCDVDPVIHRDAHCSLESQNNQTGWFSNGPGHEQDDGFAWSARHNKPLLLGLASANQAASLSHNDKHPPISCEGLKLVSVHDLPNRIRRYHFDGTCELYHSADGSGGLRLTHVFVTGFWNAPGQGAQESFSIAAPQNEGGGFYRVADYNCSSDPFVHGNVQCSLEKPLDKVPPVYDPITDIRTRHPIAAGKAPPAQVARLVGPKHGAARINRTTLAASAHAGNLRVASAYPPSPAHRMAASGVQLHASGGPVHGTTMHARPAPRAAAPNLRVMSESSFVDKSCHDTHKLIVINATVQNNGGPLGPHQWELYVMEGGGAGLSSGGVWVPPTGPHAMAHVAIPVMVMGSHIAQLPGMHHLMLVSQGAGRKATKMLPPISLPRGICQHTMRMRSLPTTKLNPQPEPPSASHRTALPAVQMHEKNGG